MKKEFSSSVSWNSAALAGLVMGVFTIAVDYLPSLPLLLGGTGVFVGILNFILKVVKIVACVIAFKYLLERFHNNVKVGYPELQRYGQKIALFSSILVSGFTMLQLLVINPDMIAQVVKSTQEAYQGMMDSNTATAMEKMMNVIPAFTFIFTLLYCYLWGWMLSTAFARRLFPVNAFGERTPDDQNTDNDQ